MNINISQILLRTLERGKSLFTVLFVLLSVLPCNAAPTLPEELHASATQVIQYLFKEDYKAAEETAKKLIRKFPDNPAGYFFMAAVIDSWMNYYYDNKREDEFYRYCDLTADKAEKILSKNSSDQWAIFFMGGAEGYKGSYEARYERWITAFRYGWRGVSILTQLVDMKSDIADVNYGIGSYEYWRSALMKVLWWMPGVKDKRKEGIEKLYLVLEKGTYTKLATPLALIDILINEKQYEKVIPIADTVLKSYPYSSQFLWGKAKALFGMKQYDKAVPVFSNILKSYELSGNNNIYRTALCYWWLAKTYYAEGKYQECIVQVTFMESLELSEEVKSHLETALNDAASLKRKSLSKVDKN